MAQRRRTRGFTMIELLVAISLFSTVTAIAVGGFANALRTQRQAAGLLAANSNVSLAIEQMSREMRTGSEFCVNGLNCPSLSELSFRNSRKEIVTYCLLSGTIYRGVGGGVCGAANFQKITGDNVEIRHLEFYRQGHLPPPDTQQPRITITLGVSSRETGVSGSTVDIQTTVSPRLPLDG